MRDEGLSPETEEVLRRARAGAPMPPAHRRRLKGAVLARVALAASASASATVAAGQASGAVLGLVAKTVVGLALASSIGAGVTLALRPPHLHAEAHVSHVAVAAPAPSVEVVPLAAVAEGPPAPRAPPRVRHVAARHVGPAPSTLAAETSLLREADRAARAGDTATALARLDEHAARFPDGVLAPERVAEHLIVMCTLSAADPRAVAGFLSSHAGSPLAARVRRACAAKP